MREPKEDYSSETKESRNELHNTREKLKQVGEQLEVMKTAAISAQTSPQAAYSVTEPAASVNRSTGESFDFSGQDLEIRCGMQCKWGPSC